MFLLYFSARMSLPAQAGSWELAQAPRDLQTERVLHSWIDANAHDFCHGFDDRESILLKRMVTAGLIWAHANGNRFKASAFLDLFQDRDDTIGWCILPTGGLLFVLKSSFVRISLDRYLPGELPPELRQAFPPNGRWFIAFGSGNRTNMFYFEQFDSSRSSLPSTRPMARETTASVRQLSPLATPTPHAL